ncbi:CRISPR-associated endoribonuclease Cas6 [Clostridium sp.]|uniref:CRISPR-associated endoribonuclease Cas6 n=1 Tax=Clostridium sp. TaxID=1506 RepID=UPI003994CF3C
MVKQVLSKRIVILKGEGKINYNYHYELMKELYEVMTLIDSGRSFSLHEEGFSVDNKKFKLFNFHLSFSKKVKYNKDGIEFNYTDSISLIISGKNDILNLILKGLIKKGFVNITGVKLEIKDFEEDNKIRFNKIMLYKVRTPIVESIYDNGKTLYLSPYDDRFYKALGQNLIRKYKALYNKDYTGELFFDIEDILRIKKKYITGIKNGFLIGYTDFEIFIEADIDMQNIAYYLGLGQNNSIGMGSLSYITGRRC